MVSNAVELARYLRFHFNKGHGRAALLSEQAAEQMQTPQGVIPESAVSPFHATEFPELGHSTYGLGFFITTYRGHKLVWHSGSLDGYSLLFSFLPREKLGVLVLTNLSGNRPVPVCVTRNVFDRLLGLDPIDWVARCKTLDQKADSTRRNPAQDRGRAKTDTRPSHALAEYSGTYAHPAYGSLAIQTSGNGLRLACAGVGTAGALPLRRLRDRRRRGCGRRQSGAEDPRDLPL